MENISPVVDISFKKIFGVEENKDLLISLINSIVSEQDQVRSITILNPYNPQSFTYDKLSILDIKAEGKDGKLFNIEMQITGETDYDKRALYYWAKLYTQQLKKAEDYTNLSKTIGIHILNFISVTQNTQYHNVFRIQLEDEKKEHTGKEVENSASFNSDLSSNKPNLFGDFEMHTIELKKFSSGGAKEKLTDIIKKVKNNLDMWVSFLTSYDLLNPDNLPQELKKKELRKALETLNTMNFTAEEREAYENHLKWLRIETNTLEKRYKQGMEKGMEKGIEKGKKEGENKKAEEIALNLLRQNLEDSVISTATGLSVPQVTKLKGKL